MIEKFKRHCPKNSTGNSNEPPIQNLIQYKGQEIDLCMYPPMEDIYKLWSELCPITSNFILTHGCEDAMGIVFKATKLKDIRYSVPTWGYMEVLGAQYDVSLHKDNYVWDSTNKKIKLMIDSLVSSNLYVVQGCNNFITTEDYSNYTSEGIIINDFIYRDPFDPLTVCEMMTALSNNQIVVGSISKFYGAGIRLGFVMANDEVWNRYRFEIYRPDSLNSLVYPFLKDLKDNGIKPHIPSTNTLGLKSGQYLVGNHYTYFSILSDEVTSEVYRELPVIENSKLIDKRVFVNKYSTRLMQGYNNTY